MSARNHVPTYRKHRQSGQGIVTLPDGLGGRKDILLGTYGTKASRVEYARVISEWEANGRRFPEAENSKSQTVNELVLAFMQHARQHYRRPDGTPTSELADYKLSVRPLTFLYGHTAAKDFGPLALKAVREKMVTGYEHPKHGAQPGLARSVVNQRIGRIRHVFRWAVENELVHSTVFHGLEAVRGLQRGRCNARETDPVKPVREAFVEATLPHLLPTAADMVRLQLVTGMRPGELVIMRGIDIDMTGKVWLYTPGSDQSPHGDHKTAWRGHKRIVPIGPRGVENELVHSTVFQAARAFNDLLHALANGADYWAKHTIAEALVALTGKLAPEQAGEAFNNLVDALTRNANPESQRCLAESVPAVTKKLAPEQAAKAFNDLLNVLKKTSDHFVERALAQALTATARKLPTMQAPKAFNELLEALTKTADPWAKQALTDALAALPGDSSPEQTTKAFNVLLDAPMQSTNAAAKEVLAKALAAAPGRAAPDQAAKAFANLLDSLGNTRDDYEKHWLAEALAVVTIKLTPEQAPRAFDALLDAFTKLAVGKVFTRTAIADAQRALAQGLAAVPGKLSSDQLQVLIDILKWPVSVGETRNILLKRLEKESGKDFDGDLSAAARWGREIGLDVTSPPRRQLRAPRGPGHDLPAQSQLPTTTQPSAPWPRWHGAPTGAMPKLRNADHDLGTRDRLRLELSGQLESVAAQLCLVCEGLPKQPGPSWRGPST